MSAMAHGGAEKRASPFVGLPVDGGLTAPAHADSLDRQTFSPTLKGGGQVQSESPLIGFNACRFPRWTI